MRKGGRAGEGWVRRGGGRRGAQGGEGRAGEGWVWVDATGKLWGRMGMARLEDRGDWQTLRGRGGW